MVRVLNVFTRSYHTTLTPSHVSCILTGNSQQTTSIFTTLVTFLKQFLPRMYVYPCSINRDKKGYNKGDGALIVGAFFKKYARESALSKLTLGTFPTIPIAPRNTKRVAAELFVRAARQHFHQAILKCFDEFNRAGGTTITLQTGQKIYACKSIILAIYADNPAAVKCAVTIAACPQCFTRRKQMALPPPDNGFQLRTPARVAATRRAIERVARTNKVLAGKNATALGICRNITTGWLIPPDQDGFTPFGPDPDKDNIYQNMPQVMLHGMDEGLTMKMCVAVVRGTIAEASLQPGQNETKVSVNVFSLYTYLLENIRLLTCQY